MRDTIRNRLEFEIEVGAGGGCMHFHHWGTELFMK